MARGGPDCMIGGSEICVSMFFYRKGIIMRGVGEAC